MAGAKLGGGEHKDDVRADVSRYLVARGWAAGPAARRAREVVDAVVTWSAPEEDT